MVTGNDSVADWADDPRHADNISTKRARKFNLLAPHIDGDVLHLGAGGGDAGLEVESGWLHPALDELADSLVGIEIDAADVEAARDLGHDLRQSDATDFHLDESFDVVVAPNIIEHVTDPGALLRCSHDHLRDGGRIVITTPRMHIPWWTLQTLRDGSPIDHPEHVMCFSEVHLRRLLDRSGFQVVHYESWGFDRNGMSVADSLWRAVERRLSSVPGLGDIEHMQHLIVGEKA